MMSLGDISSFTGSTEELDKMIEWKAGSNSVLRHYTLDTITRGAHMQRQFTIELRCDFADRDKLPELKKTLLVAARHCFATASLLADTPKTTQIAIFSNDFFSPPEEIKMMDDLIQQGLDATGGNDEQQDDTISADLAAAVTG